MELREALRQISDIRACVARGEVFRGYRSLTVGFSGVVGIVTAWLQSRWLAGASGDSIAELNDFLMLWVGAASISVLVVAAELCWRAHVAGPGLSREMTRLAVEQFLPCVVVGALLTVSIARYAPQSGWMLPGLWAFVFALGVFASARVLPRQVFWIGSYYVACGCLCLQWGQGDQAFSAWQMGVTFGGGQLLSAAILYWTLERPNAC